MTEKDFNRFMSKVTPEPMSGCWLWTANYNHAGYGLFKIKNKSQRAHRISWEHFNGEIPKNLSVCHKCDVRECVNPDHLWLGTHRENCIDRGNKKKACPKGHIYTPENKKPQKNGYSCRKCHNIANQKLRALKKCQKV